MYILYDNINNNHGKDNVNELVRFFPVLQLYVFLVLLACRNKLLISLFHRKKELENLMHAILTF